MYSRPKSEQYDSAWLRAERDLATKYFDFPWCPIGTQQEVSPQGEDILGSQPFSKEEETEFTRGDFIKALKK